MHKVLCGFTRSHNRDMLPYTCTYVHVHVIYVILKCEEKDSWNLIFFFYWMIWGILVLHCLSVLTLTLPSTFAGYKVYNVHIWYVIFMGINNGHLVTLTLSKRMILMELVFHKCILWLFDYESNCTSSSATLYIVSQFVQALFNFFNICRTADILNTATSEKIY